MSPDRGSAPPIARGRVVIVSGPSGVGKSAVADRLLTDPRFRRAVTATTRAPRAGEIDGTHYHFLTREAFEKRLADGWFLEHAEVYGKLYGTPKSSVDLVLATGAHCILVIDVQGAATLRRAGVVALYVLLTAPNPAELERRLRGRGLDSAEDIARRLSAADAEMAASASFDQVLVNDSIEAAAASVARLVGVAL